MALSPYTLPDDEDLDKAYRYAQLSSTQQRALDAQRAQQGIARSAENIGRTALGLPKTPENRKRQAMAEVQALARTVRPGTAEFYEKAAAIFQKYDLVAEAEAMSAKKDELERINLTSATPAAKLDAYIRDLKKRKAMGEQGLDAVIAQAEEARGRVLRQEGVPKGSEAKEPDRVMAFRKLQEARKAGDAEAVKYWEGVVEQFRTGRKVGEGGKSAADRQADLAERKFNEEQTEGKRVRGVALTAVLRSMHTKLNAALRLQQHPGLDAIMGKWNGVFPDTVVAMKGDAPAGAMEVWKNVAAQTFIQALENLKSKSATGASGLGQLTEREGDKIQSAEVALGRQQPTDQFIRSLQEYIAALQSGISVAMSELQNAGLPVPARPAPIVDQPGATHSGPTDVKPLPKPKVPKPRDDGWDSQVVN